LSKSVRRSLSTSIKAIAFIKSIASKPAIAKTRILFTNTENEISFIEIAIAETENDDRDTEKASKIFTYTYSSMENAIAFTANEVSYIKNAIAFIEIAIAFSMHEIPFT
jgi:hypothetical protein